MSSQALYRFYDADGVLLYVGISKHWPERLTQHRRDKVWFDDVARVDVEYHPDRDSVERAERLAIGNERPLHNIVHNTKSQGAVSNGHALRTGDVVALGLTESRCPVGEVVYLYGDWVRLRMKDWITGCYSGGVREFRLSHVMEIVRAERSSSSVIDDVHLGVFQTQWMSLFGADRSRIGTPS